MTNIDLKAHECYEKCLKNLSNIVEDNDIAYQIIWGSVAECLIVISDPDLSQVELLGVIMSRIDGGTAYDIDIWWPIRAVYQRDKNRDEFEKSYTLADQEKIAKYESFEKQYGFGFRIGFSGSFWRHLLRSQDIKQIQVVKEWFDTFLNDFYIYVLKLIDQFAEKLLFKCGSINDDIIQSKLSAYLNTIRQIPNTKSLLSNSDKVKAPKKSFKDYLTERENEI